MKIDVHKSRTRGMPMWGVTLTAAEKRDASALARTFMGVPFDTLRRVRSALATEALRLEQASDWTGQETEPERRTWHEETLLTWYAVDLACQRTDP